MFCFFFMIGPVVIVNLQMTPKDDAAIASGGIIIRDKIDKVIEVVNSLLQNSKY